MIRGIYTAAAGMLVDHRRLDVIANNLANASTTGYKRDTAIAQTFDEIFVTRINDHEPGSAAEAPPIGRMGFGTRLSHNAARLTSGSMQRTGGQLDMAITGDGFFTVSTPRGVRYTRNGSFFQDPRGTLVTLEGNEVLVNGRPVRADPGTLSINEAGEVMAGERPLGRLTIATSGEIGPMRKEGNDLWMKAEGDDPSALITPQESIGTYLLRVAHLESSNVEPVIEMVEMIATVRSYEASQKVIQAMDETLQRAAAEVGRVG